MDHTLLLFIMAAAAHTALGSRKHGILACITAAWGIECSTSLAFLWKRGYTPYTKKAYLAIVVGAKELHGRCWVGRARHNHMQQLPVLAALLMQVLNHLHRADAMHWTGSAYHNGTRDCTA